MAAARDSPTTSTPASPLSSTRPSRTAAPHPGVFQLRPRSATSERKLTLEWHAAVECDFSRKTGFPGSDSSDLWRIVQMALPEVQTWLPKCPASKLSPTPDTVSLKPEERGAERVWGHLELVLTQGSPMLWAGLHQTIRILLGALTYSLFPKHMKTHRSCIPLELLVVGLQGANELLYSLRTPESNRGKATRLLLPSWERRALSDPRGPRSGTWRRAIRSIIRRQRDAVLGGEGFDKRQRVAVVYQNGSNHLLYAGFAHEWRKNCLVRTGTVQRTIEHSERIFRTQRPGAKAHRYSAFRRSASGTHGNLIVRREKTHVAQVMETQAINGMNYGGNVKKVKKGRGRRGRPSRRPPPWRKHLKKPLGGTSNVRVSPPLPG